MNREDFIKMFDDMSKTSSSGNVIKTFTMGKFKQWVISETMFLDDVRKDKVKGSERAYCLYHNIHNVDELPKCKMCNSIAIFLNFDSGYSESCCKTCSNRLKNETFREIHGQYKFQTKEFKQKNKESLMERYGCTNAMQIDSAKEKHKKTMLENFGVENCSQSEEIKQKKIETSREKYGSDYHWQTPEGKLAQKQGTLNKYGVQNISQLDWVKEKKVVTSYQNWGVRNPSQSLVIRKRILDKNGWEYETPDGQIVKVDSRIEEMVYDYLCKNNSKIDMQPDISIVYNIDEKDWVYFPDVYIESSNTLIEVKKLDTLWYYKDYIKAAFESAIIQNFNIQILGIYQYNKRLNKEQFVALTYNSDEDMWYIKIIDRKEDFESKDLIQMISMLTKFGMTCILEDQ